MSYVAECASSGGKRNTMKLERWFLRSVNPGWK